MNNQQRRNLVLDADIAASIMEWHGGQNSKLYSLGSCTLAGQFVSVAMILAGISELEMLEPEELTDRLDVDDLISNLLEICDTPDDFSTLTLLGEDLDSGFSSLGKDESEEDEYEECEEEYKTAKEKFKTIEELEYECDILDFNLVEEDFENLNIR